MEILDIIQAGYRAQTMREDIRGVPGFNTTTSTLSRRMTVEATKFKRNSDVDKAWIYAPFPDNVGHLIPLEYYSQVKRWHAMLSKPTTAYTTSDKLFISNFRFNCE